MTDVEILYKRLRYIALTGPVKDDLLLNLTREQPCCLCGHAPPNDPHHVFGSSVSLKSSDIFTVPLCRACHSRVEAHPGMNKDLVEPLFVNMNKQMIWLLENFNATPEM
jgi:hypothetical protein